MTEALIMLGPVDSQLGLMDSTPPQLEISGIEAEGSVSEEDDEEEELVVLDPEHVSKLDY